MAEYKIKVGNRTYFNSFIKNKARYEHICYECGMKIEKKSFKYRTREGQCHISCAKLYKQITREIPPHEYEKWGFSKFRNEMILIE